MDSPNQKSSATSLSSLEFDQPVIHVLGTPDAQPQLSTKAVALVLLPSILCSFLVFMDNTVIVTALPTIVTDFGNITDIGWYSSIYLLATCCLQPLCGQIYSTLRLKYTYIAFLVFFEIGSVICARATSSGMLIAGRAIAGLAGAGVLNGCLTMISSVVAPEKKAKWTSITLGIGQLGFAFGPTVGGALTQHVGWRWNFYINLPAGLIAFILVALAPVPNYAISHKPNGKSKLRNLLAIDWFGFVLFAGSVIMLLVALQWGSNGSHPWKSLSTIGLFCGAALGTGAFVIWQGYKKETALIPLNIMKKPVVFSSCASCFLQMCNFSMSVWYLPLWFQIVKGSTPVSSGLCLLPMAGAQLVTMGVAGALAGRFGRFSAYCVVSGALIATGGGMTTLFKIGTTTSFWVGAEIMIGAGRGFGMQMPFLAIPDALTPVEAAVGNSMTLFSQYFGGAIFSGIAEAILVTSLKTALEKSAPGVNPEIILSGGKDLESLIPAESLLAVLEAFDTALDHVAYLIAGSGVLLMLACLGMGWSKPSFMHRAELTTRDVETARVDSALFETKTAVVEISEQFEAYSRGE